MKNKAIMVAIVAILVYVTLLASGCKKKEPTSAAAQGPTSGQAQIPTITPTPTVGPTPTPDESAESELLEADELIDDESVVLKMIHFKFDQYTLTDAARNILAENARKLRRNPNYSVIVEGHCDERGTDEYNLSLGQRRAEMTKKYLIALGVAANRITTISYGEEKPLDPRNEESAWDLNRRVSFVLTVERP